MLNNYPEWLLSPNVTRLGFGCGDIHGGSKALASACLIEAAFERGIRYFDLARVYGDGTAEKVVGSVLRNRREQVFIASKAGIQPWSMQLRARVLRRGTQLVRASLPGACNMIPEFPPAKERYGAFRQEEIRRSVEASLKALRTDYLDVLLLHECGFNDATSESTLRLMQGFLETGIARAVGIATDPLESARILSAAPEIYSVAQTSSDLFCPLKDLFPYDWRGLTITHSSLKYALGRSMALIASNPAFGHEWSLMFDAASDDPDIYASLLLQEALSSNPGMILFSTTKIDRINNALYAASADPKRLVQFRNLIDRAISYSTAH